MWLEDDQQVPSQVVQDDGVEFPTKPSSVKDPDTGEFVTVEVPQTKFCCRCRSGCHAGMPYLDDQALEHAVQSSAATKELCKKVVELHFGDVAMQSHDTVHTGAGCSQRLVHLCDGYQRDEFPEAHGGCTPDDLKIPPKRYQIEGEEEVLELYWSPSRPAFRMETEMSASSQMQTNQVPSVVYSEQPLHTHQYCSKSLKGPTQLRMFVSGPYGTRAELNKAIKDVQAAKAGRTGDRAAHTSSPLVSPVVASGSAIRPVQTPFPSTKAPVQVPSVPTVGSGPLAKKPFFKTVKQEPGSQVLSSSAPSRPTAAKSTSIAAPASPAKASMTAPCVATLPQKRLLPRPLVASSSSVASEPPSHALGVPLPKVAKVEVPQRNPGKDLTAGLQNVVTMDFAQVRDSTKKDGESSSEAADIKGMGKFEKAHVLVNLPRILMGENLELHIVNLRKNRTLSIRESPDVWYPKLDKRLNCSTGAQQLVIGRMMLCKKFADVVATAEVVQTDLQGEKLTKFCYVDYSCAFVATKTLPPWVVQPDLHRCLRMLTLSGEQSVVYSLEAPSLLCNMFDFDDLSVGIIPQRVCHFLERYVLSVYIRAGDKHQELLRDFLENGLVPTIESLPRSHSAPCYGKLKTRAKGLLCLIGEIPFILGSTASDTKVFREDPNNPVSQALMQTPWTSQKQSCANMLNSGERVAWPQIQSFVQTFKSGENASVHDRVAALNEMMLKYPKWKQQVRPTALPREVHKPVLVYLKRVLDSKENQSADPNVPKFDHEDGEVQAVLATLQKFKALGWAEGDLNNSLTRLQVVSKQLVELNASNAVIAAFEAFNEQSIKVPEDITKFAKELEAIIPAKPAAVRVEGDRRLGLLNRILVLGAFFLDCWPNEELYNVASFILSRLEVAKDPVFETDGDNEIQLEVTRIFILFRRLQGWWQHLNLCKAQMPITAELVEQQAFQELAMKLILYHDFFSAPEFDKDRVSPNSRNLFGTSMMETSAAIIDFKVLFQNGVEKPLRAAQAALHDKCGGASGGNEWDHHIAKDLTWKQFFEASASTLRSLNKVELIKMIREVDTVSI